MRRWPKACLLLGLVGLAVFQAGCVSSILAKKAVTAPNQQRPPRVVRDAAYAKRMDQVYTQARRRPNCQWLWSSQATTSFGTSSN